MLEVAAAQVGTAISTIEMRMTRLRFMRSVKVPSSGAAMATPRVEALTVQPTADLEAWKSASKRGSSGWVE